MICHTRLQKSERSLTQNKRSLSNVGHTLTIHLQNVVFSKKLSCLQKQNGKQEALDG